MSRRKPVCCAATTEGHQIKLTADCDGVGGESGRVLNQRKVCVVTGPEEAPAGFTACQTFLLQQREPSRGLTPTGSQSQGTSIHMLTDCHGSSHFFIRLHSLYLSCYFLVKSAILIGWAIHFTREYFAMLVLVGCSLR